MMRVVRWVVELAQDFVKAATWGSPPPPYFTNDADAVAHDWRVVSDDLNQAFRDFEEILGGKEAG